MTSRIALRRAVLATAAVVAGCGDAAAQQGFSVDVNGGVSVSTNPYLLQGPDTGGESVFVELVPRYVIKGPTSASSVTANVRVEPYSRRYSTDVFASLDADHVDKVSERLTLRGGANFQTSRSSAQDTLFGSIAGGVDTPPPPPSIDPTAVGRIARVTTASLRGGLTYITGPRGSLEAEIQTSAFRSDTNALGDYYYARQRVGYGHSLSSYTRLITGVTLGETNYVGTAQGDGVSISPLAGVEVQFNATLKGSLSGGVSLARFRLPDGSRDTITALAVQGRLCDTRDGGATCIDLDRSVQPTALGTLRTLTGVVASYNRRLGAEARLTTTLSYNRSDETTGVLAAPDSTFVAARAEVSRRLSARLDVFGSAAYSDIYQNGFARQANIQGRLGIRLRAGSVE